MAGKSSNSAVGCLGVLVLFAIAVGISAAVQFWKSLGWWHWIVFPIGGLVLLLIISAAVSASAKASKKKVEAQRKEDTRQAWDNWRRAARQTQLDKKFDHTLSMSPREFEELIARLLRREGFSNARVVGGANDRGADVIASRNGKKVVVQCKRYRLSNKVNSGEMQKFVGMCFHEHHADIALFVTTSTFTKEARAIGLKRNVRLIDGPVLSEWQTSNAPAYLQIKQ